MKRAFSVRARDSGSTGGRHGVGASGIASVSMLHARAVIPANATRQRRPRDLPGAATCGLLRSGAGLDAVRLGDGELHEEKSADRGVRVNAVVLAVALGAMGLFVGVGAQGPSASLGGRTRRATSSTPSGRSHCRTNGKSAASSDWESTRTTTSGCITGRPT